MAKNGIRFAPSRSFMDTGSAVKQLPSLISLARVATVGALKIADTGILRPVAF